MRTSRFRFVLLFVPLPKRRIHIWHSSAQIVSFSPSILSRTNDDGISLCSLVRRTQRQNSEFINNVHFDVLWGQMHDTALVCITVAIAIAKYSYGPLAQQSVSLGEKCNSSHRETERERERLPLVSLVSAECVCAQRSSHVSMDNSFHCISAIINYFLFVNDFACCRVVFRLKITISVQLLRSLHEYERRHNGNA